MYAAVDPVLERSVAIKMIRRDLIDNTVARERFRREARVVASRTDPNICRVYEVSSSPTRRPFPDNAYFTTITFASVPCP